MSEPSSEVPGRLPLQQRARTAALLLTALAVVLLAASIALGVTVRSHVRDRDALEQARIDAVAAARQEIINLDSLNHATIDADFKLVLDGATGTFKDQFSRAQAALKPVFLQRKTVLVGTVLFAGVVRADTNTATVLLGVDRTVRDSTDPAGAVDHYRWRVDLEKHAGRWLVAQLQPVS